MNTTEHHIYCHKTLDKGFEGETMISFGCSCHFKNYGLLRFFSLTFNRTSVVLIKVSGHHTAQCIGHC